MSQRSAWLVVRRDAGAVQFAQKLAERSLRLVLAVHMRELRGCVTATGHSAGG